jgi:hypothetical protein
VIYENRNISFSTFDKASNSLLPNYYSGKYNVDNSKLDRLNVLYKEYITQKRFSYLCNLFDKTLTKDEFGEYLNVARKNLIQEFSKKCYDLINNSEELFDYLILLSKNVYNFDFTFIWDMLDDNILSIIPHYNSYYVVQSDSLNIGTFEYLGR